MPLLVSFKYPSYYMKISALRDKLRASTRTGKKLCWDKPVVGYDEYIAQNLATMQTNRQIMWFTGSLDEFMLFKLGFEDVANIDKVVEVTEFQYEAINATVQHSLTRRKNLRPQTRTWWAGRSASTNRHQERRKIFAAYQGALLQFDANDAYVESGAYGPENIL